MQSVIDYDLRVYVLLSKIIDMNLGNWPQSNKQKKEICNLTRLRAFLPRRNKIV